jgi:Xaa-Pro dipeptidase
VDSERLSRARKALTEAGFDLLVCRMPENILFLSGYWPLAGVSLLLLPLEAEPVCIVPTTEEEEAAATLGGIRCVTYPNGTLSAGDPQAAVARILAGEAGRAPARRVGVEGSFESMAPPVNAAEPILAVEAGSSQLRQAWPGCELRDATAILYELRARKTELEAGRIRVANEIAALGLAAFARSIRPGVRGVDLLAEVEHEIVVRGSGYKGTRHVRAFAQVSVGARETSLGYRPCEITTTRRLEAGEIALLELAVAADGYWSDRTRPCVAGEPTAEVLRLYNAVIRAQAEAVRAIKPGVRAGDVDAAARTVLESAGLGREFLHVTGHGIGFRYHEPIPLLAPGSTTTLEEGMTFSVEPGVYSARFGGIRIEDDVLVTPRGAEVLGPAAVEFQQAGAV